MKKILLIYFRSNQKDDAYKIQYILFCIIIFSIKLSLSQTNWFTIYNSSYTFHSCYFLNNTTGFASSDGCIFKTTDGGTTWIRNVVGDEFNWCITFTDVSTGYMSTGHSQSPGGWIYKTTDSGSNWFQLTSGLDQIYTVYFLNTNTGIYPYKTGQIKRTTDAGNTWNIINSQYVASSYFFVNINTGYGVTDGSILKSTNSGINWVQITSNPASSGYTDIYFVNEQTGIVSGNNGVVLRTTNTGINWELNVYGTNGYQSIYFTSPNTGYICGWRAILRTTNSGLNWIPQSSIYSYLKSIYFPSPDTGYAVGYGTILKTINGTVTGIEQNSTNIPGKYFLAQNYPNPFNPTTNISYDISNESFVKIVVYDMLGREVIKLLNEKQNPGNYVVQFDGSNLASGVYFYKLQAGDFIQTKRMTMLR